jgi:hypothetical protein
MKSAIFLSLLVTGTAFAQELTIEKAPTAAQAHSREQRKLDAERSAKKMLEEKPITYSGFLVDLSRAEKNSHPLSLRKPLDPKTDHKNLHFDEKTSRPKGFVLFALSF